MADGISVRFDASGLLAEFARIDKAIDRATMYAVRQGGRKVKQFAAKGVPVYTGPARNRYYRGTNLGPMAKGDLKKSIRSAKQLKRYPGGYGVTVGPRGVASIYAGVQEARRPFMAPAVEAVRGLMPAIAEASWSKTINRK